MLFFKIDYRELTHAAEDKSENKADNKAENISIPDFLIKNYFKLYSSSKMSICKFYKKNNHMRNLILF